MIAGTPPTHQFGKGSAQDLSPSKPLLLCFSHLRWDFVWQRPHHLLSRATARYRVVFVEEASYDDVATSHLRFAEKGPLTVATPVLPRPLQHDQKGAVQKLRGLMDELVARDPSPERIFWYYTPMALPFSRHIVADLWIYDNMDELSAFCGAPPELVELEAELFRRADLVFTGGQSLFESKRGRHPDVHAFPSSVDATHFASARKRQREPDDQARIAYPRLGFFGVIDERMDLDLVLGVAERRPYWQLVMIGPIAKIDPGLLPRLPNIHWLGQKNYDDLPTYLAGWDIGFMPFAINEATRFISPTKTPEFLAAGVPVVSTPILDVVRPYGERGLVAIARSLDEVVSACEQSLARGRAGAWLRRVDRHLASMSWDRTWAAMERLMQAQIEGEEPQKEIARDHATGVSAVAG